jgi:polyphosphate kinase 2 (PPK2 family)
MKKMLTFFALAAALGAQAQTDISGSAGYTIKELGMTVDAAGKGGVLIILNEPLPSSGCFFSALGYPRDSENFKTFHSTLLAAYLAGSKISYIQYSQTGLSCLLTGIKLTQ